MPYPSSIAILSAILLLTSAVVVAADAPPEPPLGQETEQWLRLQRSGYAASKTQQTVSGPIAGAIYRRYVDSFKHPIPEYFQDQRRSTNSGKPN